mgnify:CR=1 FL=1
MTVLRMVIISRTVNIGWHYGFSASALGMAIGLIQFYIYNDKLEGIGVKPIIKLEEYKKKRDVYITLIFSALLISFIFLIFKGIIEIDPLSVAQYMTIAITLIALSYFLYIFSLGKLSADEKNKVFILMLLFFGAAIFWSGFDQGGSSFNIFAKL